jgi:hypothetical protein
MESSGEWVHSKTGESSQDFQGRACRDNRFNAYKIVIAGHFKNAGKSKKNIKVLDETILNLLEKEKLLSRLTRRLRMNRSS